MAASTTQAACRFAAPHHHAAPANLSEFLDLGRDLGVRGDKGGRFPALGRALRPQYAAAVPFPHMIIDDLFAREALARVAAELPEQMNPKTGCIHGAKHWNCYARPNFEYRKSTISQAKNMGPATKRLLTFLRSAPFVNFLEKVSGIPCLAPDPSFEGAGVHLTGNGGYLQLHADFNRDVKHHLFRRVNTFIFLNGAPWPDEYGGHLELWNRNLTSCEQRIAPTFGRFVVFSSNDFSYHGHPKPLKLPPDRMRRSIAYYYYTREPHAASECLASDCINASRHSTLWQKPVGCNACQQRACRRYSSEQVPSSW